MKTFKQLREDVISEDAGEKYIAKHKINSVYDLIDHISSHKSLKKYHDTSAKYDDVHVEIPHDVLKKHTGITKKHLDKILHNTEPYSGNIDHEGHHVVLYGGD